MALKKLKSTFINMTLVLCGVTLVSSLALSYVYNNTKDRIQASKDLEKLTAVKEVLITDYDNNPSRDMFKLATAEGEKLECYPAKQDGKIKSVAIKTFTKMGFSGEIWLMVGLLEDGTINKISVIDQKETPGLGTKIADLDFKKQFYGKNPKDFNLKVKNDGGDIDALTAATISSRAFCDAVERAYKSYITHNKRNKK